MVNAAGNNAARALLLRDVRNITATLARSAPELLATKCGFCSNAASCAPTVC